MESSGNIRIELDDLVRALTKSVEHLKEKGREFVEIDEDYYWAITDEQLYNPNQQFSEFMLGQLLDPCPLLT